PKDMTSVFRLATIVVALALCGQAEAQEQGRAEAGDQGIIVTQALAVCGDSSFEIIGDTVCLAGIITTEMAVAVEAHTEPLKAIVLNTPGGDMAASLRLGRRLFKDKAEIIVDGECSSSCANYLAPLGFRKLHVTEGSFIAMHGTPPRGLFGYIEARRRESGQTVETLMADPTTFFGYKRDFPKHMTEVILPEVQYFADVQGDEAYATRFIEVMRTLEMRPNYGCAPMGPTLIIIGPQWMRRFRINRTNVWWMEDRRALIERLPESLRTQMLIIDGDEHPSWIPGRGFVTPQDCMTARPAAPDQQPDRLVF
ncbi:MAG: hypothetical protein ACSLE1_13065, partial [Sphingobium sp.]